MFVSIKFLEKVLEPAFINNNLFYSIEIYKNNLIK